MTTYFGIFVVLLVVVSRNLILSNKNDTIIANKLNLNINEAGVEHTELKRTDSFKLNKREVSGDSTTYRSIRQSTSPSSAQDRDTKLMKLLASRRSALHRDRFRTHRRVVTTGRTRPPAETTSEFPLDLHTKCVRNCTKNLTRRTTASCMRQCTEIQRQNYATPTSNFTSEEEKSQKDINEILLTDESSHGFFIVAKDFNNTMNHISEIRKVTGSTYKTRTRGKQPNSSLQVPAADSYSLFGRKIPSLPPSFLSFSTVNEEHPQVLEVSVSQNSPRAKISNKLNNRDRNSSTNNKKLKGGKLSTITGPVISVSTENLPQVQPKLYTSMVKGKPQDEQLTTSAKEKTIVNKDITPGSILESTQYLTESTQFKSDSTPLIINVIDVDDTTSNPEQKYMTETTESYENDFSTELVKNEAQHFLGDKSNLIIFINKSSEIVTQVTVPVLSSFKNAVNPTKGITVVKTTILSSVRSTVFPPVSKNITLEQLLKSTNDNTSSNPVAQYNTVQQTTLSSIGSTKQFQSEEDITHGANHHHHEDIDIPSDTRRQNIATYVLAGLGMFPVLVVIVYVVIAFGRHSKNDESFDVCIPDQQPISPLNKITKFDEKKECEQFDYGSIISIDEFQRHNLRLKSLLGEGNFGQVWKAEADDLKGHVGATRIVAVKTVRFGSSQDSLKEEAIIMRKLGSHTNVVTLLGACVESEPHMLIMEFAMRGRLLSLLRATRSATNILPASVPGGRSLAPLSPRTIAGFALDIAAGMEFIAEKRIVHRDLAARNILIDHNGICKICDFGMSIDLDVERRKCNITRTNSIKIDKLKFDFGERLINHWSQSLNNNTARKSHDKLGRRPALPIRWMAPESLQYNEFSIETDVWSFGIVLWEIATLGATPYSNLCGREVVRHVLQGTRPELPKEGRHRFFDIMSQCWHKVPELRPTFRGARLEIYQSVCKWMGDDAATSDYMDVSGFSEDLEHGMVYFNQRISQFECDI